MKNFQICFPWFALFFLLVGLVGPTVQNAQGQDKVDFVKEIKPIFEKHCMKCHGAEDEDNGVQIIDKEEALAYVVAESPDDSEIYLLMVSDDEDEVMPPPDFEHQVNDSQKALVKKWIEQGAEWPDDVKFEMPAGDVAKSDDGGKTEEKADGKADDKTNVKTDEKTEEMIEEKTDEPAVVPVDPKVQRMYNAAGSLHPAVVHLPIGLLLAAGFFALLSLRGSFVMSDCAYYCLWLGALGSILASASGWFWSPMENKGTVEVFADLFDSKQPVYWHRLGGIGVSAFSLILALFAASARSRDPDEGVTWKFGAILLAGAVGWVGHTGGDLHYGPKHYKDLNAVWQDLTSGGEVEENVKDGKKEKAEPSTANDEDIKDASAAKQAAEDESRDADDDTSQVGKTSAEEDK